MRRRMRLLCIWFPVWRELKPKYQFCLLGRLWLPLYMVSRLKGIETVTGAKVWSSARSVSFVYGFPFEGNWNSTWEALQAPYSTYLCIWFPVWRELKHSLNHHSDTKAFHSLYMVSRLKGIETTSPGTTRRHTTTLCIWFPVWRELKLVSRSSYHCRTANFVYGFPFEGNWNWLILFYR